MLLASQTKLRPRGQRLDQPGAQLGLRPRGQAPAPGSMLTLEESPPPPGPRHPVPLPDAEPVVSAGSSGRPGYVRRTRLKGPAWVGRKAREVPPHRSRCPAALAGRRRKEAALRAPALTLPLVPQRQQVPPHSLSPLCCPVKPIPGALAYPSGAGVSLGPRSASPLPPHPAAPALGWTQGPQCASQLWATLS